MRKVFAILFFIGLTWAGCTEKESHQTPPFFAQRLDSLTQKAFTLQYNVPLACDSIAEVILKQSIDKNYTKGIANAWFLKSSTQQQLGNYDSAITLAFKSLAYFIEIGDRIGQARVYNDLGIDYDFKADYAKAIDNYLKALKIFESVNDAKGISNALNNIGLVYQNQKNLNEARGYHSRALVIAKENQLEGAKLNAMNSLGSVFMELGDFDSALFYHEKVLAADLKSGNKTYISYSYNNVGEAYLNQKEFDKAILYFDKSRALKKELGNRRALANTLMNLGDAFLGKKEYDRAKLNLEKSLAISIDLDLPEKQLNNYELLHQLAIEKQNYKLALSYYKKAAKVKEEISHDKEMAEISRLEKNYEVEKAERSVNEAENNARISQQLSLLYGSLAILLVIVLVALGLSYRQKRKRNILLTTYKTQLEQQNQELEEKNKLVIEQKKEVENALAARSRFLSFMSHEIRTPLNGITGLVDLLQAMPMMPEQREYMEALKLSADNLLLLLNNILDLSRLEAGRIELEKSKLDVSKLIADQAVLFKASAMLKDVDLQVSTDDAIPTNLQGDNYRITQIITNLINNAIKFTRKGWVKLSCELIGSEGKEYKIRFAVQDNGIGISKDKLKSIVEPFSQAESHTTRKYGGSGLGLAIVQLLLDAMGSKLEIESEPENGSTFSFVLTLPAYETPILANTQQEPTQNRIERIANKKILVVEDNTTNILVLTKVLASWRIEYDIADNGYKAIEYANEKKYDIILMDLHLPKITGYETAQRIKTTKNLNVKTPIIAITAADESEISDHPQRLFLDGIMFKPVQTHVLLDSIITHIS